MKSCQLAITVNKRQICQKWIILNQPIKTEENTEGEKNWDFSFDQQKNFEDFWAKLAMLHLGLLSVIENFT